jgi:hypothetical protein
MMTQLRAVISIVVLSIPSVAAAQGLRAPVPKWTLGVSGGHASGSGPLLKATRISGSQSGMALDTSSRAGGGFGVTAEIGLFDAVSFLGGVRWTPKTEGRVRGFAQVLIGPTLLTMESTAFTVQPGAGADFLVSPRMAVRFQTDFRSLTHAGNRAHQLRVLLGVAFNSKD